MSLNTVMKPHRKNSEVMIANGPRYVWPPVCAEDIAVGAAGASIAVIVVILIVFLLMSCSDRQPLPVDYATKQPGWHNRTRLLLRVESFHYTFV
jgi:hypothetical protein